MIILHKVYIHNGTPKRFWLWYKLLALCINFPLGWSLFKQVIINQKQFQCNEINHTSFGFLTWGAKYKHMHACTKTHTCIKHVSKHAKYAHAHLA